MDTRIGELIAKQLTGKITPNERPELNQFETASEENRQLVANLTNPKYLLEEMELFYGWDKARGWKTIQKTLPARPVSYRDVTMPWKKKKPDFGKTSTEDPSLSDHVPPIEQ